CHTSGRYAPSISPPNVLPKTLSVWTRPAQPRLAPKKLRAFVSLPLPVLAHPGNADWRSQSLLSGRERASRSGARLDNEKTNSLSYRLAQRPPFSLCDRPRASERRYHIQQRLTAVANFFDRAGQSGRKIGRLLDALAIAARGLDEFLEGRRGLEIGKGHRVVLLLRDALLVHAEGRAAHRVVDRVVVDDSEHRQVMGLTHPMAGRRVGEHVSAVADRRDDQRVGPRQLCAERGAEAPAEAAGGARTKIGARLLTAAQILPRPIFVDEDRVGPDRLAEAMIEIFDLDSRLRARFLDHAFPRRAEGFPALGELGAARRGGRGLVDAGFAKAGLDGVEGGGGLRGDREIAGEIADRIAREGRIVVDMDDAAAGRRAFLRWKASAGPTRCR